MMMDCNGSYVLCFIVNAMYRNTKPSPPPGEKQTALVASFACACVRFRLFRFVLFSSFGVDVVIMSTISKAKWNTYTQISWI